MAHDELAHLDATAQADLVRRGEVSPTELVHAAIERIERINPQLNAVIHPRFERARAEAASATADAPFRGVPLLIKDCGTAIAGEPAHNAMRGLQRIDNRASQDSWHVARYRRAGFVLVGQTTAPELGLTACTEADVLGPTHNPWDLGRTTGGSSGGAAASVAAGLVPLADGSDGGGSIRIPAACCGLVGLKPSRGRITNGPKGYDHGLTVHHVLTRSVRDTAAVLDATHGPGPGDGPGAPAPVRAFSLEVGAEPGRLRIGILTSTIWGAADPVCVAETQRAARLLESLGHHVEDSHPSVLDDRRAAGRAFAALWSTNAAQNLRDLEPILGRPVTEDDVEAHTWLLASGAAQVAAPEYAEALAAVARFRRAMAPFWTPADDPDSPGLGFDLLLTPTLSIQTPRIGELKAHPDHPEESRRNNAMAAFTSIFNLTGQPAISLPLGTGPDGMPIGIQLAAGYGREDVLLRVAAQLEQAAPWSDRRPPVHA